MSALRRVAVTNSPAAAVTVPSPDGHVEVSFVFVTFGTDRIIIDAIDSVVRTVRPDDHPYEIVVVDNPHPDVGSLSMRELALSTSGVRVLVPSHNLGFAGGCELGALHARGRVLAFLNPDVVVPEGWLDPLLAHLEQGAAIAAPVLVHPSGTVQEAGAWVDADGGTHPHRTIDGADVAVDYASAACWVVTRDAHERLGGFDAGYFPAFYEDVDLALRATADGGRLDVVTDVRVVHHRGGGSHRPDAPPDTTNQRERLLAEHPSIRWTRPPAPSTNGW